MTEEEMYDMYRLLAIAKYDERYVIPPAHAEQAHSLEELATECSVSEYGGGQHGLFGEGSGRADPDRGRELPDAPGPADLRHAGGARATRARRVNLLNWDGKGSPAGLFPPQGGRTIVSGRTAPKPTLPRDAADRSPGSRSRCCSTTPTRRCSAAADLLRSAVARPARPTSGDPLPRLPRPPRVDAAAGAPGRLRRDLRHPAPLQPLPDLLRPRRHPQARDGAAALQADLPARRASSSTTGELPDHLCVVLEFAATVDRDAGPGPAARPPGRAGAAAAVAARHGLAVGRRAVDAVTPRCRRCAATSATPYAGSPPRARPRRRSGSRRSPARSSAPAPPPARAEPTLLPMPSFPGARR